jgi:sporulation protein YlmC with PRC-barrel domain
MKETKEGKVLSATTIIGDSVRNLAGEDLGEIEELMIDTQDGCIRYAVLSFGGILGIGDKLFAVTWNALQIRPEEHAFILDVKKEQLENAPGFDKDNWPDMSDPAFVSMVHSYYSTEFTEPSARA